MIKEKNIFETRRQMFETCISILSVRDVEHTLGCKALFGPNEIVTHLPLSEDIYDEDEYEEVYIARTLKDNMRILPLHCGPCEPA